MDPADRFSEQRSDADDLDFRPGSLRHGIGGDDFLNRGIPDALVGQITENGVGNSGVDAFGTVFVKDIGRCSKSSGGFRHVVDEQDIATFDFGRSYATRQKISDMIWNGVELARLTGEQRYLNERAAETSS